LEALNRKALDESQGFFYEAHSHPGRVQAAQTGVVVENIW